MTRERDYGSLRGEKFDSRDLRDPRRHHVYDLTRHASGARGGSGETYRRERSYNQLSR